MIKKAGLIGFIGILAIGLFLRFYKLGSTPNGLYQDETAIGYNAYSILTTGKDEYGKPFPLYFKSFGDYKLPVYMYATVPSIKLFGLTPFAVRFPSAFFGFLTILLLYILVLAISKKEDLARSASFLLAINPWHIHYSRAAFEVTIALFLFLLGTVLLHKAYERKSGYFLTGTVCFLLGFYSYNLTRLLAPILYITTLYLFHKKPGIGKLETATTLVVAVTVLFPFIQTFFAAGGVGSAEGTLIFTSAAVQAPLLELRSYMLALPPLVTKMFFNFYALTGWQYLVNIASYVSVPFFFISGSPHGNHGIGNVGQFYLFELPLVILGAYLFLKEKNTFAKLLFAWLGVTIMVAAFTREAPHATRSFFLLFPMIMFSSQGLLSLFRYNAAKLFIIALAAYNIVFFLFSYFVRFPVALSKSWRASDGDVSVFIKNQDGNYDRVLIDKKAGLVYTSVLFYTSYPPEEFQRTAIRLPDDSEGFSEVLSFGKFEIRDINESDFRKPKTLIVTTPDNTPKFVAPYATFYYPSRPVVIAVKQQVIHYPVQDAAYVVTLSE